MAQTVLITGGSRGIGAACVRVFAENGWNTAFTYSKSREAADRLAGETGALALSADQQDTAAVELAVAEGKARFGTIDAVVCNAGIAEQKLFQNITDADWMHMLDVNLMGTVRTIRAVLPEMLHNHKGSIVTVSSMWGECGASCESHYSASKAAIIGLSKSLAQELGPSNIRVNCIALAMIEDAEQKGILRPGSVIIEPTSGNTGVGLAWVASVKGYKAVLTMPETMSLERQNLLKAMRAELVLTPGNEGMSGAIKKAEELRDNTPGAVILQQFENPANPRAHSLTTAKEVWQDTDGKVDVFIAGVGTGGTLSGVGEGLKSYNPNIEIVAVEPDSSAVLSGEKPGMHKIQGIGAGFIPSTYNTQVVDKIIRVKDDDAIRTGRELSLQEGLLVGISSGAATFAALQLSQMTEYKDKNIVVLLPDTGERYLSTVLYAFEEYPL